ncbi:methionine gamma-lyase [uncultured Ilyobacter sp.]|uniref:methionine gamma-lyase n=1 Tax=uncultured Ilyobacter sp. TaxID=544433 RepID=UPI0029C929AA|nr:methionine gamma-lyase [uncultured Ilyobacter sp.]
MKIEKKGFGTKTIHGGHEKNPFGTLTTPIYQTSTFVFDTAEQGGRRFALEEGGYIYSRLGNPTTSVVESKLAALEGAEAALATGSGMGAISSTMWTLLKAGDHLLADETLYGCTYALLSHGITKFGIEVDFVDTSNPEAVRKAMKPNTRIIYLETPANPNLKIVDVEKISEIAHKNEYTLVVVDNTFATPFLQNPIKQGADIVVHSATKYLNGHGDIIAGFVAGKLEHIMQIRLIGVKDMTGSVLGANDAYMMIRGMKTLEVRMQRHCENAMTVANFLKEHERVEIVHYPGLENHPGHEIAKKQMNGFGGIIAFELKGGLEAGKTLLNNLELCTLAVSLGDTETLIQHPASMTHSPYTREERLAAGITDGLVRISVGLENSDDIIEDLRQGLSKLV